MRFIYKCVYMCIRMYTKTSSLPTSCLYFVDDFYFKN